MSSNLPGFLRRTLRVNSNSRNEEGDEDEDDDAVVPQQQQQQQQKQPDPQQQNQQQQQQQQQHVPRGQEDSSGGSTNSSHHHSTTSLHNNNSAIPNNSPVKKMSSISTTESNSSSYTDYKQQQQQQQQRPKSYKEIQFEKVITASVVNMEELRKLSWNGIPVAAHRSLAWKILLGYVPTNQVRRGTSLQRKRAEYSQAIAQHYDIDDESRTLQEQETLRQVLVDVPRTAPEVPLFRNERIKRSLARLLYIWAMRHPASSYVQGINDLAIPLITVFLSDYYTGDDVLDGHVMNQISEDQLQALEADVYGCLTNLLAGIQDHYTADQPGVQRMVMRLEELVHRIDANLCRHFSNMGILFLQFSFRWMNCLLLREFQLPCVIRLWDTYLSEENGFEDFHVYVCAAFLCQFSAQFQEMSFDELFQFMQALPTHDWGDTELEMLLSQAYVLSNLFQGSHAHLTSSMVQRPESYS